MSSRLCRHCSKIPFDPQLKTLRSPAYAGPRTWHIRPFGRVRASTCPFCDLISSLCRRRNSNSWERFTPPDDSDEVTVHLDPWGFRANLSPLACYVCVAGNAINKWSYNVKTQFDEFIDFHQVHRWISACHQKHGGVGGDCRPALVDLAMLPRTGGRQLDFRVIDVNAMCIIYAPPRCRYIALSYMWGTRKKNRLVLTTRNEDTLMQPGALTNTRDSIPNTILDAISVVQKLRGRYLWVDSLCLLQDDSDELQDCVAIMNLFYETAILTIVAGDGEDAWAGLRGVSPTPRRLLPLAKDIVPGLKMTTLTDMELLLRRSTYSTRAWT